MALTKDPGSAGGQPEEQPQSSSLTTSPTGIVIPDSAPDDDLLAPFGMEEHPTGGFHGLLEVIPTKADLVIDLIRANSLWPLLSGLSCDRRAVAVSDQPYLGFAQRADADVAALMALFAFRRDRNRVGIGLGLDQD